MKFSKQKHAARRIPQCYYCKEKGHIDANCPNVPTASSTPACIVLNLVVILMF